MAARKLFPLPWYSALLTDTRLVMPPLRSRTKTSTLSFVSPGTRFDAAEEKTTYLPVREIAGASNVSGLQRLQR